MGFICAQLGRAVLGLFSLGSFGSKYLQPVYVVMPTVSIQFPVLGTVTVP